MILDEIREKLEKIDPRVFYGKVDRNVKDTIWNYIVFNRGGLKINPNKTGYSDVYEVHIIREEFVPEGIDVQVIEKMQEINGMRVSGDGTYAYTRKQSTDTVVEMLSLTFVRARKNV